MAEHAGLKGELPADLAQATAVDQGTTIPILTLPRRNVRRPNQARSPPSISPRHPKSPRHGRKLSRKGDFFSDLASLAFPEPSRSLRPENAPPLPSNSEPEVTGGRDDEADWGELTEEMTTMKRDSKNENKKFNSSETSSCHSRLLRADNGLLALELLGSCGIRSCPVSPARRHRRSRTYGGGANLSSVCPQSPKDPRIRRKQPSRRSSVKLLKRNVQMNVRARPMLKTKYKKVKEEIKARKQRRRSLSSPDLNSLTLSSKTCVLYPRA